LSTVGTAIGAALAISTQENALVAAAPASAAVALRKSRRARSFVIEHSPSARLVKIHKSNSASLDAIAPPLNAEAGSSHSRALCDCH